MNRNAAALLALALLSLPAHAQDEPTTPVHDHFAITGATVHTGTGLTLHDATVLCRDGLILRVGHNVPIPDDARTLDATGLHVYPGFIAPRSAGILAGSSPEDATDLFSLNLDLALAAGITTLETDNTAAKCSRGSLDRMVIRKNLFEKLEYSSSNPDARRRLRAQLDRLLQHRRDLERFADAQRAGHPDAKKPDDAWIKGDYEKLRRLLDHKAVALFDAQTADDLLQICDLVDSYRFPAVVRGAREAWTIPQRIARARIDCIITPRDADDPDPDSLRPTGSHIENAAILRRAGVRLAFIPAGGYFGPGYQISLGGLAGRDLLNYPLEAAFAVRGGLSEQHAIDAITIDAARILRIEHRVGSIEPGKDADFAVTDGNPLSYRTSVLYTIVNGRIVYDKRNNSLFSHIRTDPQHPHNPPPEVWPRRLGDPPR